MTRIREDAVRSAVAARLRRRGFEIRHEFPVLGRVADLYGVHRTTGATVAVECKERDWSGAIVQARVYQAAAESVYVAMPLLSATTYARARLAEHGLGLLIVRSGGRTREVLRPRQAEHFTPLLLSRAKERFEIATPREA